MKLKAMPRAVKENGGHRDTNEVGGRPESCSSTRQGPDFDQLRKKQNRVLTHIPEH